MPYRWKPIPVPSQAVLDTWGLPGVQAYPETDETDRGVNKLTWLQADVPLHPQAKFGTAWDESDAEGFDQWLYSSGPASEQHNPVFIDRDRRQAEAQRKLDLWSMMNDLPNKIPPEQAPVEVDVKGGVGKMKAKKPAQENMILKALGGA